MSLQFEWDPNKAASNIVKHGVSFGEASTAFSDSLSVTIPDPLHSADEERRVLIGRTLHRQIVVVVAHTERGDRIRIISGRRATRKERGIYEAHAQ